MRLFRLTSALMALLLAFGLAACGEATPTNDDNGAESDPTERAEATQGTVDGDPGDPGDPDTDSGDARASAEVTLTGGDDAGTYSGSVSEAGCSRGASGAGSFGVQYSTDEDEGLTSVQVVVYDREAAATGTDDFLVQVTIGPLFSDEGTTYEVEPLSDDGEGSGTLTLDDGGGTAAVRIEAQTADGVDIEATVTCHSVFDMGG